MARASLAAVVCALAPSATRRPSRRRHPPRRSRRPTPRPSCSKAVTVTGIMRHERALPTSPSATAAPARPARPAYDSRATTSSAACRAPATPSTSSRSTSRSSRRRRPRRSSAPAPAPGLHRAGRRLHDDGLLRQRRRDRRRSRRSTSTLPPTPEPQLDQRLRGRGLRRLHRRQRRADPARHVHFAVKVDNAAAAGASAVVIFNEGQPGRTDALRAARSAGPHDVPVLCH